MFDDSTLEELRKNKFQVLETRNPSLRLDAALCRHVGVGVSFYIIRRSGCGKVAVFYFPLPKRGNAMLFNLLEQWAEYFREKLGGVA